MSEASILFQCVSEWTRHPLLTQAEMKAVQVAIEKLHKSYVHAFKSPWDLAKMVSAVVRCALPHIAAVQGTGNSTNAKETDGNGDDDEERLTHADMKSLVAIGFGVCPSAACRRLREACLDTNCMILSAGASSSSNGTSPPPVSGLSLSSFPLLSETVSETKSLPLFAAAAAVFHSLTAELTLASSFPSTSVNEREEPVRVVLSLCDLWHKLEVHVSRDTWRSFYTCSLTVECGLQTLTTSLVATSGATSHTASALCLLPSNLYGGKNATKCTCTQSPGEGVRNASSHAIGSSSISAGGVAEMFGECWLANMCQYGARYPQHATQVAMCMIAVLKKATAPLGEELEESTGTACSTCAHRREDRLFSLWVFHCLPLSPALMAMYRALREALFLASRRMLHRSQTLLQSEWTAVVRPKLACLFDREPAPLTELIYEAVGGDAEDEAVEEALRALMKSAKGSAYGRGNDEEKDEDGLLPCRTARDLADALYSCCDVHHCYQYRRRSDDSEGKSGRDNLYRIVTQIEYERHIVPAAAACLRKGLVGDALGLLETWNIESDRAVVPESAASSSENDSGQCVGTVGEWVTRLRTLIRSNDKCIEELPTWPAETLRRQLATDSRNTSTLLRPLFSDFVQSATLSRDSATTSSQFSPSSCSHSFSLQQILSPSMALDALLTSSDVVKLRVVCDGTFRVQTSWGRQILRDPLSPLFLLLGVARLAHGLLSAGDVPLARAYVSMLASCVAQCPCREGIAVLLQTLGRLAGVVTFTGSTDINGWPLHTRYQRHLHRWRRVADVLDALMPSRVTSGVSLVGQWWLPPSMAAGATFHARRCFFSRFFSECVEVNDKTGELGEEQLQGTLAGGYRDSDDNDGGVTLLNSISPFTVVTMHYQVGGGSDGQKPSFALTRDRHNQHTEVALATSAASEFLPPFTLSASLQVAPALQHLVQRTLVVMEENRRQLARGCAGGGVPAGDLFKAVSTTRSSYSPSLGEATSKHETVSKEEEAEDSSETKMQWWSERFKLDRALSDIATSLASALDVWRLLLVGDVSLSTRVQLWSLTRQLTAQVGALVCARCPSHWKEQLLSMVAHRCFYVVHGLPHLRTVSQATEGKQVCGEDDMPCTAQYENITTSGSNSNITSGGEREESCGACTPPPRFPHVPVLYCPSHLHASANASGLPPTVVASGDCAVCASTLADLSRHLSDAVQCAWLESLDSFASGLLPYDGDSVSIVERMHECLVVHHADIARVCKHMTRYILDAFCEGIVLPGGVGDAAQDHVDLTETPREHVYLAFSGTGSALLHLLSWEALDVLHGSSVSRVPSAAYVADALSRWSAHRERDGGGIDAGHEGVFDRVHLHVDMHAAAKPERFAALVKAHPHWTADYCGVASISETGSNRDAFSATSTTRQEPLLSRLVQSRVSTYVYIGHNRGEDLISRASLYDRFPTLPSVLCGSDPSCTHHAQLPAVLLMGCSSARMLGGSLWESYGMPYAYLHAGAPCFIGCLWDVTNADIDRLTRRLLRPRSLSSSLSSIAGMRAVERGAKIEEEEESIGELLARARGACRLTFLSAFATVLYGMNVPAHRVWRGETASDSN